MSKPFIHQDFLLGNPAAVRLYFDYAEREPILDYHCHLPPVDIAKDRRFGNLFEIWLEGDHYKWRAMRSNGVDERFCTGDASPVEKFQAWARTVPYTLRNPLYHWTHLELERYFGIQELLNEGSAQAIWERANERLASPELSVHGILKRFQVRVVGTTDDPTDDLAHHRTIAASGLSTRVVPTFRPDKALRVDHPKAWNAWVQALEKAADLRIASLAGLLEALKRRHDFFHEIGGRLSDHGLERCPATLPTEAEGGRIFENARGGRAATAAEQEQFASLVLLHLGRWNAEKGWTLQLHLGARRNNNTRLFGALGPDTGFDSIGGWPQVDALAAFLDRLDRENALPKTILYSVNPADNYPLATMLGNFQDGSVPGKIQLGSGWWFLDQKEAMEWQMNALSNNGLLSRFIGMLTDSRSFMSFPRHEYFRRVLCNLVGRDMETGELPDDFELVGGMVRNLCYGNAREYLGIDEGGT
jgi:glucuronate isomerase